MNFRTLADVEKSCLSEDAKEQIRNTLECLSAKRNKYHNKIIEIDRIKFRSKKEGNRYLELKALQHTGEVIDFSMQVPFVLTKGKKKIRYFCDFKVVWKNLHIGYEDVKGHRTELYKLKKELMKDQYMIEIEEI